MDRNKVAGIYTLVVAIIVVVLSLLYILFYISYGRLVDTEGFGALYLIFAIIIFGISLVLLFSALAIKKNKKWGKIVALIVFILFALLFAFGSYQELGAKYAVVYPPVSFFGFIISFLVNLIGAILIGLSFKK